jgi:hypothetical protein
VFHEKNSKTKNVKTGLGGAVRAWTPESAGTRVVVARKAENLVCFGCPVDWSNSSRGLWRGRPTRETPTKLYKFSKDTNKIVRPAENN